MKKQKMASISLDHLNRKGFIHLLKQAWSDSVEDSKPLHKRTPKESDDDDDEEYEKLADLHEEQHGTSNPPKVKASDLADKPMKKPRKTKV